MSAESRDEIIAERRAASNADFMAHGPRITAGRETYVLARGHDRVLIGGVGGMGIGRMWVRDEEYVRKDPTYAGAPFDPDQRDDFGDQGHARADR